MNSRPASAPMGAVNASREFIGSVTSGVLNACGVAAAILREIFDESAYERFLVRNHLCPGAETYARFCAEQDKTKGRRPRCC
jgi:hypothetical protein